VLVFDLGTAQPVGGVLPLFSKSILALGFIARLEKSLFERLYTQFVIYWQVIRAHLPQAEVIEGVPSDEDDEFSALE
jgi:hypothetical protein